MQGCCYNRDVFQGAVLHNMVMRTVFFFNAVDGNLRRCIPTFHNVARMGYISLAALNSHYKMRTSGAQPQMVCRGVQDNRVTNSYVTREMMVVYSRFYCTVYVNLHRCIMLFARIDGYDFEIGR